MKNRVYNFSSGPAMLPESVLLKAQAELLNHHESGQSVMEMSHRSSSYESIHFKVEKDLRRILNIPENYEVLFLQGGASLQFHMIPLNLLKPNEKAGFLISGQWAQKAYEGCAEIREAVEVSSTKDSNFTHVPEIPKDLSAYAYVHYVSNNTIYGTRVESCPPFDHPIVVADMSSDILSREIDVSKHGIIFAGAQKNMGISGLTVLIIRKDLLGRSDQKIPTYLNYVTHQKNQSLYNTAPTYPIYMAGLVLEWIDEMGGLKQIEANNSLKAQKLYDYLDASDFYVCTANKENRSWMNVTFKCPSEQMDTELIKLCQERGLVNLKGYRTVGGLRASIYNAMPMEGIDALISVLKDFKEKNHV